MVPLATTAFVEAPVLDHMGRPMYEEGDMVKITKTNSTIKGDLAKVIDTNW